MVPRNPLRTPILLCSAASAVGAAPKATKPANGAAKPRAAGKKAGTTGGGVGKSKPSSAAKRQRTTDPQLRRQQAAIKAVKVRRPSPGHRCADQGTRASEEGRCRRGPDPSCRRRTCFMHRAASSGCVRRACHDLPRESPLVSGCSVERGSHHPVGKALASPTLLRLPLQVSHRFRSSEAGSWLAIEPDPHKISS